MADLSPQMPRAGVTTVKRSRSSRAGSALMRLASRILRNCDGRRGSSSHTMSEVADSAGPLLEPTLGLQTRASSSAFFALNSSSVRMPASRSEASLEIISMTSGVVTGAWSDG